MSINYFGSGRMLELAKECKNFDVFLQVSTCYVNCDKRGEIHEKIYPLESGEDYENVVRRIMALSR